MKVRHRMEGFSFYDYDNIAIHLEKMAQKGWMLEKICNGFWKYRKIQPQKLKFAVTYFWEASDENMQHTENQEIFLESCEQAGWKLCAEWMQMQIFYSEQENPIPIETDEAAKLDNIHLCMSQQYLKINLFLLLIMSVLSFSSGVNLIKTPTVRIDDFLNFLGNRFHGSFSGIFAVDHLGVLELVSCKQSICPLRRQVCDTHSMESLGDKRIDSALFFRSSACVCNDLSFIRSHLCYGPYRPVSFYGCYMQLAESLDEKEKSKSVAFHTCHGRS